MVAVNALPAGADLDRLVVEQVLGWRARGDGYYWHGHVQLVPIRGFSPSTNIAHAWEVVMRMRDLKRPLGVIPFAGGWSAVDAEAYDHGHLEWADSAPLAICRAALKALHPSA